MSFVLDALNKADREQRSNTVEEQPTSVGEFLSNQDSQTQVPNRTFKHWVLILLAVLILSGLLGWLFWQREGIEVISDQSALTQSTSVISEQASTVSDPVELVQVSVSKSYTLQGKPDYKITGHIFLGDGNSANKVFINEKAYRVNDNLPDDYRLINVTNDFIVVEKTGTKYTLDYFR